MPYATNPDDGVRIYYEVEGDGPPLVLHHGGGSNLDRWREFGYVAQLGQHFRLILFDARGHGRSDQPHDVEAYRFERWVSDVVTLLDDLGIDKAHFYGSSLGALVGFRILKYQPERFRSLVLGGGHPYTLYEHFNRQYEMYKDGIEGLIEQRRQAGNPVSDEERQRIERMDPVVVAMVGKALRDEPSVAHLLPDAPMPMLLYAGTADGITDTMNTLPQLAPMLRQGAVHLISGLDHFQAFQRSEHVIPHVAAFLERVEAECLAQVS